MATLKIVNPNQTLTGNLTLINQTSESWERFREAVSELKEDNDKSGFRNLTDGADSIFDIGSSLTGTSTPVDLYINARGGNDSITLYGLGNDTVYAGSGDDTVYAGRGNDKVFGGSGNDRLSGAEGNDTLEGGSGADVLLGGQDVDQLFGGTGNDLLYGGAGVDVLFGGADDDRLYGDDTNATFATKGNDTLDGGYGNDWLYGGMGSDTLVGGDGADVFAYLAATDLGIGHTDVIRDFSHAEGDRIDLSAIDPNASMLGNQSFFMADGPSALRGALWLGDVANGQQKVFMNAGSGDPLELIVRFDDLQMTTLQASDFIF